MIRAWLIRHAQSESNAGLPSADPGAAPLTELGHQQAELTALAIPEEPALIVTSPFIRARQTAEPAIKRFPASDRQEWPVQEFTYLGELYGRHMTTLDRQPHVQAYWDRFDPGYASAGGESFADLVDRVSDCLKRLDALAVRETGPVAVFTHGFFMKALAWSLLTGVTDPGPVEMRNFRRFANLYAIPNGGIIELRCHPGGRIVLLGASAAHLPEALAR